MNYDTPDVETLVKPDIDADLYEYVTTENKLHELIVSERELECPKRPFMVETWEQYVEYVTKTKEYEEERIRLRKERVELQDKKAALEERIYKAIPQAEIWFRSNDGLLAYGIEYHDWGGKHYRLDVRAWGSTLTSLDHRYHEA